MNRLTRTIKKYPNRRLYDTQESRYITLNDIGKLVIQGESLRVLENKTGREITATTLLQALIELDSLGGAPMSDRFLARIMQAHGRGLDDLIRRYLDLSLDLVQPAPGEQSAAGNGQTPVGEASYQRWLEARRNVISAWATQDDPAAMRPSRTQSS